MEKIKVLFLKRSKERISTQYSHTITSLDRGHWHLREAKSISTIAPNLSCSKLKTI
jgi:hypothetical protein